MRKHKVVYEVYVSPVNTVKCTQFMTQKDLSELLARDGVRLICVNTAFYERTPRQKPKKQKTVEDPQKQKERQERRLSEYLQKKGR